MHGNNVKKMTKMANPTVGYIQGLDKIIGTPPFLVLYLKRPTRATPIVGGLAVFFEF